MNETMGKSGDLSCQIGALEQKLKEAAATLGISGGDDSPGMPKAGTMRQQVSCFVSHLSAINALADDVCKELHALRDDLD